MNSKQIIVNFCRSAQFRLTLIMVLLLFSACHHELPKEELFYNIPLARALQLSGDLEKYVFVDIYTDWCYPCKKMDHTTFRDSSVILFMDKQLIPIKLNAEKSLDGTSLAKEYSVNIYPTYLILDHSGKEMGRLKGFMKSGDLIQKIERLLSFYDNKSTASFLKSWRNNEIGFENHRDLMLLLDDIAYSDKREIIHSYTNRLDLKKYDYDFELISFLSRNIDGCNGSELDYLQKYLTQKIIRLSTGKEQNDFFGFRRNLYKRYDNDIVFHIQNNDKHSFDSLQNRMTELLNADYNRTNNKDYQKEFDGRLLAFYKVNEKEKYYQFSKDFANKYIFDVSPKVSRQRDLKSNRRSKFINTQMFDYGVESNLDSLDEWKLKLLYSSYKAKELADISSNISLLFPNDLDKLMYASDLAQAAYQYFEHPEYYLLRAKILVSLKDSIGALDVIKNARRESFVFRKMHLEEIDSMMLVLGVDNELPIEYFKEPFISK